MAYDIAVIGGGLAGLVASIDAAKAGLSVALVEKANRLGGRAMTVRKQGAMFNIGGHALYTGGEAMAILKEYGVKLEGGKPTLKASAIWNGGIVAMPGDPAGILRSPLLGWGGKARLIRLMVKIMRGDGAASPPSLSLREWAEREIGDPMVRHLFYSLCRTATYAHDPDGQSAGPVLAQVKRALKSGVFYVNGGWQTIVDRLTEIAEKAGVEVLRHRSVEAIEQEAGAVRRILFTDGTSMEASQIVSAVSPAETYRMTRDADRTALKRWKEDVKPVMAACLDLNLRKLPVPGRNLVLGVDQPVFFSNHSNSAVLSDDGTVVVHLIRYKAPGEDDPKADERQLERAMSLIQPGWEKEVVARQFLPSIPVVHDYPRVGRTEREIGPAVPGIRGLYVAGDWAGRGEMLADAAAASGRRAALQAIADRIPVREAAAAVH